MLPLQVEKLKNALITGKKIQDLHQTQKEVFEDPTQYKFIVAGSGWGKSFLAILELIRFAIENPGSVLAMVSPTDAMNIRNIWDTFKQIWDLLYEYGGVKEYDITADFKDNVGEIHFFIDNYTSKLYFLSGYNDERIRGLRINYFVGDEWCFVKDNDELWETVSGRLTPPYKVLIISTPPKYGVDKLYEFYNWGQKYNEDGTDNPEYRENCKSWHFTSFDNKTIDGFAKSINEKAKLISKDGFNREFLGIWNKKYSGTINKEFDRNKNIVDWEIFPDKQICISSDWNVIPMTSIAGQILTKEEILEKYGQDLENRPELQKIKLQDNVLFVFKEWKFEQNDMLTTELCQEIKRYLLDINYDAEKLGLTWYGDPHGRGRKTTATRNARTGEINTDWSFVELYFPTAELKNDKFEEQMDRVSNFTDKINNYLNETGILIHKNCEELVKDILLVRKDAKGGIDKSLEKKVLVTSLIVLVTVYPMNGT